MLFFIDEGFEAVVFIGNLNYSTEFKKIIKLEETLQHQNVISNIDSWIIPFCQYVKINFNTGIFNIYNKWQNCL